MASYRWLSRYPASGLLGLLLALAAQLAWAELPTEIRRELLKRDYVAAAAALLPLAERGDAARSLTDHVTILTGPDNGAYPSGNSVLVRGAGETIVIDPSVTVVEKGGVGMPVDGPVRCTLKITVGISA